MADAVITVWFEVQRTWTHLESIFMSSEDIRKQLPVDSDRFDRIDHDFKILMDEMVHNCTNNFLLKIIPILIYFS